MLLLYFKNLSKSNLMLFCHIQPENHFLMRLPSPDGNGILLYIVFLTRYKRYSVSRSFGRNGSKKKKQKLKHVQFEI